CRRHVAHGISGAARERDKGVVGFRDRQQAVDPARGDRWRQHLVNGSVEELARTEARQAPEHVILLRHFDERIAELQAVAGGDELHTRSGPPHLAQQAVVDALWLLARLRDEVRQQALDNIGLLIAIQSAGETPPEYPPVDFILRLIAEVRPRGEKAAHLLDAVLIADIAEAGAQTESAEVEPADFMCGRALAVVDLFEKDVGERAGDIDGPGVAAESKGGFEARGEFFGREFAVPERGANELRRSVDGFLAHHCGGMLRSRLGGRRFAELEMQARAVLTD